MTVAAFLERLSERGIELWADRDELVVRAPRGLIDDQLRGELKRRKAALLTELRQRDDGPPALPALRSDPAARHQPFPLTEIQRAYWFGRNPAFELGAVGIHVYEEISAEDLDVARLEEAWNRVLDRHEMLRCVVLADGRQHILPEVRYRLATIDLRGLPPAAREEQLLSCRRRWEGHVYSPEEWPLFRLVAVRLTAHRWRLFVSIDALHVDMGSFAIVFRDWMTFYREPAAELPKLEVSYRDYALALREVEASQVAERDRDYWRRRAAELPPAPQIAWRCAPGDLPRQRFERRKGRLQAARWQRVKKRAAAAGLTPSGLTLAVFAEVLATWAASPRMTLNVTLFNRLPLHPQVNGLVGDFTSMVLLGVDMAAGESFEERSRGLQKQLWRDLQHRTVSGVETLREVARAQGKQAGELIMPYVFTSTLNLPVQGVLPLKELGERSYNIIQTPQVSLDLQVFEEDGDLVYHWDWVDGLFETSAAEDMFAAFRIALETLADREASWQDPYLPLLPASQVARREVVNATAGPVAESSLVDLLAAAIAEHGDQPAVLAEDRELTFDALDRLANGVAWACREAGLGAERPAGETPVAIVLEKGWQQVVAALGVLRAGAPYLPIDAAQPVRRRDLLLADGDVRWVIAGEPLEDLPPGVQCLPFEASPRPSLPAAWAPRPEDLAYILYTSGSTGSPKGVMIEHRSLVNRILDVNRRFGVGPEDRAFGLTALHHDLSTYDLFGILAAGGALVLPRADGVLDPAHWAERLAAAGVTLWNSVPAFLGLLVEHLEKAHESAEAAPTVQSLRLALLAGDWIPVDLPDRARRLVPGLEFVSLGGPTETTVWDICYPVEEVSPAWSSIPYGRPMTNASYYVLDERLAPRPDGVAGEMYIAGVGLARGYWRDPVKTDERFLDHPETGRRLYRSGDRGRFLADGNLEILGRVDFQLKVRGVRIEAAEVEAAIEAHDDVQRAVVSAAGEGLERQLVAHVVPAVARRSEAVASEASRYRPERSRLAALDQAELKLSLPGLRRDAGVGVTVDLADRAGADGRPARGEASALRRRTCRRYAGGSLPLADLAGLLTALQGERSPAAPLPRYRFPSAGSLYPVQTYLQVAEGGVEGLAGGTYYYHPVEHRLTRLGGEQPIASIHVPHNVAVARQAPFALFFVGALAPVRALYGDLARDFCLLEAGAMLQLLMTEAERWQLGLCPVGDLDVAALTPALRLEPDTVFLHGLLGGRPAPAAAERSPGRPLESRLREWTAERLPAAMVPSAWVVLDELPLTANGKVDRRALPAPRRAVSPASARPPAAPVASAAPEQSAGSALEGRLTALVGEVLGIAEVRPHDRFFEFGANSVDLVRIAIELRRMLDRDLSVVEIFRHPTVASLAAFLDAGTASGVGRRGARRAAARRAAASGRRRRAGREDAG
ncbi:MAG: amino acid adenylation domain-containing protein [Acidobacteriota bacterium]